MLAGLPLAVFLLIQGWRNRSRPGGWPFVVLIALSTLWAVGAAFELLAADLGTKLLLVDLQYLPICFIPVVWLALALDYTGNRAWLTKGRIFIACLVPLTVLALQWTNSYQHLMRTSVWLDTSAAHAVVGRVFGPAFWFHAAYSYILIVTAMAFLAHAILSRPRLYRKQPAVLLVGFAIPLLWNAAYLFKSDLFPAFDYTPALFTVGEIVLAYGLFRFRVFNLVVVARDALLDRISDALLVLDETDVVVDANEPARKLMGRSTAQILGRPVAESWEAWPQVAGPYRSGAGETRVSAIVSGGRRDYEVRISELSDGSSVRGRLLMVHDVTERFALEESLRQQALTDGLTGLANRSLFMAKLTDVVHLARRHPERMLAVIVLDLDRFKFINDTIGHPAGDVVLQTVAVRLKRCIREADSVARLGGDEFIMLLSEITDLRDVVAVLERIQDEMHAPIYTRDQQVAVSVSTGAVLWDASYNDAEDLVHAADVAMYQAKQAGGGCYRVFDERMHRLLADSAETEAELRAAVEKGAFELEYQPVIDLATGKVISLEALVRWQHPRHGSLPPNAFIGAAEASGLIVPLGEMVLDRLCSQLSEWRRRGSPAFGLSASVNVSPRQLTETDFVRSVLTRATDWRLPSRLLAFEMTEAALARDPARTKNVILELSSKGMKVCLDEFGSGSTSLRLLNTFPGHEIKLDRTLISGMAKGTDEFAMSRALIDLAHALHLTVTAEGVESRAEYELLEGLGCDRVQGLQCGEPMAPGALIEFLKERQTLRSGSRSPAA